MNKDLAFLIGAYFGNLNKTEKRGLTVTIKEEDVAKDIAKAITNVTRKKIRLKAIGPQQKTKLRRRKKTVYHFWTGEKELIKTLERLTKSETSVPLNEITTSFELRKAFLEGLFKSGGIIREIAPRKGIQVFCYTPNKKIAEQTTLILAELGIYANIHNNLISINEMQDMKDLLRLNILGKEKQQQLRTMIKKITPTKPIHTIKEYEDIMNAIRLYKNDPKADSKIARLTREPADLIRKWRQGVMPWSPQKLAKLEKLSKRYKYKLKFLKFYPESLKASRKKTRKIKTTAIKRKIRRVLR